MFSTLKDRKTPLGTSVCKPYTVIVQAFIFQKFDVVLK